MAKSEIVSAIDLGSSKITTIIAQVTQEDNSEREINVVGVSSVDSKGVKKGQIINIDEAVENAILSIEAAERMAGYNLDRAYVSLGGASITSQNSHGVVAVANPDGEIVESDVERVIDAASAVSIPSSRELIHVIPREFTVDGEDGVKDPLGMSGVRLEVESHLITASVSSVKNLRKALNDMGVAVDGIVYGGLAASTAVLSETEKELGCVLVDIGAGTTSVTAYVDGAIVYSGIFPIGAKNITNDLAIGLRVSLATAEKLKILLSEKKDREPKDITDTIDLTDTEINEVKKVSKKTLGEGIMKPRLNEIFTIARIELEKVGVANKIPSGVIITGGGALTFGVADSAKHMMSLPVRIGKPTGISGLVDDIISPAYATPVGLIKYGAMQSHKPPSSFVGRLKLPTKGILGKLMETVKDLLP